MFSQVLYQLKSLPIAVKLILAAIPVTVFACVCLFTVLLVEVSAITKTHHPSTTVKVQATIASVSQNESASTPTSVTNDSEANDTTSPTRELTTVVANQSVTIAAAASATAAAEAPIATATAVAVSAGPRPADSGYVFVYETSHSVTAFASAFNRLGGVRTYGFPLTEPFIERSSIDGKGRWVQYFEKAVIEYHPDLEGANAYQLFPLGSWRFDRKYPGGADRPAQKSLPGTAKYTFAETHHTVQDPFLTYWHSNGEVLRFGYPISEVTEEKSDVDGNNYLIQYFERAVMEYHPELGTEHSVQLSALGAMRLQESYPNGAPLGAGNPQPSPTPTNTPTPVPPTPTPIPTNTPDPTILMPAELEYLAKAKDWVDTYSTVSGPMSDLLSQAGEDPYLVFDDDWKLEMATYLAALKVTDDDILSYGTPPRKFAAVHREMRLMATDMNSAVSNLTKGIDNLDPSLIQRASTKMKSATGHLQNVADMLKAMVP